MPRCLELNGVDPFLGRLRFFGLGVGSVGVALVIWRLLVRHSRVRGNPERVRCDVRGLDSRVRGNDCWGVEWRMGGNDGWARRADGRG